MSDETKILVPKITAARRQLDAAIRMYFHGEDALATYTVAAASNRIFRDLISAGGGSAATHILQQAFNYSLEQAVDILDNWLRDQDTILPEAMIHEAAEMARNMGHNDILKVSNIDKIFWHELNHCANFLKHADRDAHGAMLEDEMQIEPVLDSACAMYLYLITEITPEMHTYWVYRSIGENVCAQPTWIERQRTRLARAPIHRRRKACLQLIAETKRALKASPTPRSS